MNVRKFLINLMITFYRCTWPVYKQRWIDCLLTNIYIEAINRSQIKQFYILCVYIADKKMKNQL
jgi:hypothetical protein